MPNIKFNYLYRDSGNYKVFNSIIFQNKQQISLNELEKLIRSKLIYGEYFYAEEWKLPELFTEYFDFKVDPTWHEFEGLEYTDEPSNVEFTITDFVHNLASLNPIQ